jgi:hypothetical protein
MTAATLATYFDRALAYARRVVDGAEVAGRFERLACQRFLRDLERQGSDGFPYLFDEVLALRVEKNDEGQTVRAIQTYADPSWTAKDRSGKLDMWEAPDLGAIIKKIRGEK